LLDLHFRLALPYGGFLRLHVQQVLEREQEREQVQPQVLVRPLRLQRVLRLGLCLWQLELGQPCQTANLQPGQRSAREF
jgi:hypothetical protein